LKKDRGKFITFEGIDGCGKSTQAKRLLLHLNKIGIPALLTLEPGGTKIGSYIRRILLDPKNKDISELTELFLYLADRSQHLKEVIEPSLRKGVWVVSDRFYDATLAYQGFGRGISKDFILMLNDKICGNIKPDVTFLLDCPVEIAMKRRSKREFDQNQLRFEQESISFHERVRKGYLWIAEQFRERVVLVDATLSVEDIERFVFNKIKQFLESGA
jgi:dTMP kinase